MCICQLGALPRSFFLVDFHQNWPSIQTPKSKNEFVRVNIAPPLGLLFAREQHCKARWVHTGLHAFSSWSSGALPRGGLGWTYPPHFFPEGVSGIESLWSVLTSFRLYPQTLPPDLGGDNPPAPHPYCPPTLFDLVTPLLITDVFRRSETWWCPVWVRRRLRCMSVSWWRCWPCRQLSSASSSAVVRASYTPSSEYVRARCPTNWCCHLPNVPRRQQPVRRRSHQSPHLVFLPRDALQCKARSCYHMSSVCPSVKLVDH